MSYTRVPQISITSFGGTHLYSPLFQVVLKLLKPENNIHRDNKLLGCFIRKYREGTV